MNPSTILTLDRLGGKPFCVLLTLIESVRRLIRRPTLGKPRRILFVKLIEMGSTVIACPAFAEAARMVGRENLFILVFAENRAIVDLLPYFPPENVLTIDQRSLSRFVCGLLKALGRIRSERIDTAIDLEGLTRSSAIITYLTGAPNRVGYYNFTSEGPYRGRLFTRELNYGFQHHTGEMFLAMVRAAAAPEAQVPLLKQSVSRADLSLPEFTSSETELSRVRQVLREQTGSELAGPVVLLNPNCSDLLPLRRWAEANFIELARRILDDVPGSIVAITGAPAERTGAEALAGRVERPGRCVCMAGRTTLRELFALYRLSRVLVSNDSGPCHFASLTPIPIVALFGPETPLLYAPLSRNAVAITAGLACSPCVNMLNHRFSPCTDNRCMKAIAVDEVYGQVRRILSA